MTFGDNLRRIREARGLMSKELAEKLGVAPSVISGWENDRRGLPETPTLFKLATALDCRIEDLLADIDAGYSALVKTRLNRYRDELLRMLLEEKASSTPIDHDKLVRLLDEFEMAVTLSLETAQEAEPLEIDIGNYKREDIPIIQEGEASPEGLAWDAESKSLREVDQFTSRPSDYRERGAYAVVLRGDSMEPCMRRGMRLIISPNIAVSDGDIAYVQLKSGERLIKIATKTGDGWLLTSANPAYAPRSVKTDEIEHVHRVAYVRLLK